MVLISLFPTTTDTGAPARRARGRPTTLSPRRLRRERGRSLPVLHEVDNHGARVDAARPRARAECRDGPRPCLWVSCRFHLYLDVNEATGALKLNFPDKEPWELEHSCVLDIAERGGLPLEQVGALLNVTRERARQIENTGIHKLEREL